MHQWMVNVEICTRQQLQQVALKNSRKGAEKHMIVRCVVALPLNIATARRIAHCDTVAAFLVCENLEAVRC